MRYIPYGVGFVEDVPLVSQADTKLFKTSATLAAGDFKWRSDGLILTTPTTKRVAFTSGGTYVVKVGDVITGHTSAATATILGVRLTSGTWAGGDAAGSLFVEGDSGTFQSENLDVGANLNVATIGGALGTAGTPVEIDSGIAAIGISSAFATCRKAVLVVRDAAGAEWCDTGIAYETYGHEASANPQGCLLTDAVGTATGQTTTNIRLSGAPALPAVAPKTGDYFEVVSGTAKGQRGHVKSYTAGGTVDVVPYVALGTALDATSIIKFFGDAPRVPAHIVAKESTLALSTQEKSDVDTEIDARLAAYNTTGVAKESTSLTIAGYLDTEIAAIFNRIGAPSGASIAADILAIITALGNPAGFKKNTLVEDFSFAMRSVTGALVPGLTVTVEIQKDGGAFAPIAGSVAEVGSTGIYQVTTSPALLASEMNANQIVIKATALGAVATVIEIYTEP